MLNNYIVYVHINKTNNKRYYGLTSKNPNTRWGNGCGYKNNKHFYSSIQKYGWDGFDHIIVALNLSKQLACELLRKLIREYKTQDPLFGYNIELGGQITHHALIVKYKISLSHKGNKNANYGKKWSELIKYKIRKSISGLNSPCYCKHPSELTRRKMSLNHADFKRGKHPEAKKVICILTNLIFECIVDAALHVNTDRRNISACCNGYQKTCKNLHWKFLNDIA